jgi:hypothetical protein
VEEGRLNNKDKVFIKIKGLYTGTMEMKLRLRTMKLKLLMLERIQLLTAKNIYGMRKYMMIHRNGQAA